MKNISLAFIISLSLFLNPITQAQIPQKKAVTAPVAVTNPNFVVPAAPDIAAKAYILVDAATGTVLAEKNADERLAPASLTKLMSLYVIFKELSQGKLKLTDMVPISEIAWRTGGSRMFVQVGTQVSINDLLQGIIVASGNDATVAMAEHVAGTQTAFAQLMDAEAKNLGMINSNYTDATGLPDKNHYSTARDFSILSRALIRDYPQYYHYFSQQWFTYNNVKQPNRNTLLWGNLNVDGLKTGHTDDAGYCLIGSAKQGDMRLIAIVMGTKSEKARAAATQALLQYGFRFFKTKQVFEANQVAATARVYGGENKFINAGVLQTLAVTTPANVNPTIDTQIQLNKKLHAPIMKGDVVGTIKMSVDGKEVSTANLVALEDDSKGSLWRRFIDWFASLFG
jgi:D-alanyl-D-alanine carboxypeptidase (penicillin-binding protein 5/6)